MKIIDFKKRGNVVRFYCGKDDYEDYWGDDWRCNENTPFSKTSLMLLNICSI